jgi:hypothetical protein
MPYYYAEPRFQIFNDFAIYTKKRIQARRNITKIVKVSDYNKIYDNF